MNKVRDKKYLKLFGYRLRELRVSKSLTQEQLANDADIPINQIGRIERGEVNSTLSTLKAISDALQIPLSNIFDF